MLYIVTGIKFNGKRFVMHTNNRIHALGINLWRGSVWQEVEGKRKLLKRVRN